MNSFLRFKKIEIPPGTLCGVISDTHSTFLDDDTERTINNYFNNISTILHLGDVTHPSVINDLEILGYTVHAVLGNNDRLLASPHVIIIESGPFNIAMIHGGGGGYQTVENRALRIVRTLYSGPIDCLIYGHTHVPRDHFRDGIRFLNPGSLCYPREDIESIFPPVPHAAFFSTDSNGINFDIFTV